MKLGWPEFIMVAVTMVTVIATVLVHYEGLSLIGRAIRGRANAAIRSSAASIFSSDGVLVASVAQEGLLRHMR